MNNQLLKQWKADEKAQFEGWDFSYIKDRYEEGNPPWNYIGLAKTLIKQATSVLDMATGGGEKFLEILSENKPPKAVAIEGYEPNVEVANKTLSEVDVKTLFVNETKELPFPDQEFDLVLNRHGGFNIKELARIIKPRGLFFTQQVESQNLNDLQKEFGAELKWMDNTLPKVTEKLKESGFEIEVAKEWTGKTTFKDIGALVYFLRAAPWIVDGFSVETHLPVLKKLQAKIEANGELAFVCKRFLILAKKT